MKPNPERLKDLREFVKHCERVTVPGVVSGENYLHVVRELLAACEADQPAPTETETGPESLADYELWLERKRAAQTAGPFDPRTMLAADNFLAEPAPTETGPQESPDDSASNP